MLFSWPLVCIALFARLPVDKAAIWSLLAGYLLLPSATSYDIGLLPPLDKHSVPTLSAFLLCWFKGSKYPPPRRPIIIYVLAAGFVVAPVLTSLNNSYELQIGETSLRGFYALDGYKLSIRHVVELLPLFMGMRFVSSEPSRKLLVNALAVAALAYSIPMLFEIRFSPNLHYFIYGFSPSDFVQAMRGNGFRPIVFLNHGLAVAIFTSSAVIAGTLAIRMKSDILGARPGLTVGYLSVVLVLCKSLASLIYAIVSVPLILFTRPKTWVRVSSALLLIVCTYPILRTYEIVPVHHILRAANAISPDRESSLQYRIENEDKLLVKANEKPFFGWGTWGRNRVYSTQGLDESVTDGEWIIQFGQFGLFGYVCLFGLFAASSWRASGAVRGPLAPGRVALGGLSLMLAISVVDQIPNAGIFPLTFLAAGSIAGCVPARAPRRLATQSAFSASALAPSN